MNKKKLGNSALYSSPIVFGGNVFGWTLDEKQSFKMLDEVYERGFDTIDTADVYSRWAPGNKGGESENIIGKWMKQRNLRDKITLITKVGSNMIQGGDKNISREYILKAVEDSLKRLQTSYIDLYFTHYDDDKTPVEETLEAYEKLIAEGKVRVIGASNMTSERLMSSLVTAKHSQLPQYEVFQPEYNLVERTQFEGRIKEICLENNLGVIPYFSLASGFLTGKYRKEKDLEGQQRKEMVKKYFNERGLRILTLLDELSHAHKVSNAAVALGWLMHQDGITAPIASATKSYHLKSFSEATELRLSQEELKKLNEVG